MLIANDWIFLKLPMLLVLYYGWEPMSDFFTNAAKDHLSGVTANTDEERIEYMIVNLSRAYGLDLTWLFEYWSFPVSEQIRSQVISLPKETILTNIYATTKEFEKYEQDWNVATYINVNAKPFGGGRVSGSGFYKHGAVATVSATANEGYEFVNWTEDGEEVSTQAQYTFTIESDRALRANFALKQYSLTLAASPAAGGAVDGGGTFNHGAEVTVEATANAGYEFVNWTEDGEEVSTEAQYTFIIELDRDLEANFALKEYTLTLTAAPEAGGSVEGDGTYNHGEEVTVTATANEGYEFVNWTEGGEEVSTDTQYTFTIESDRDLIANFALKEYTLTLGSSPATGGAVNGSSTFNHGEEVTVTATASAGYEFVNWTEDGEEVSTETQYTFTIEFDRDLTANFEQLPTIKDQKALYVQNPGTGQVRAWLLDVDADDPANSKITSRPVIGSAPAPQADWRITAVHDIDGSGSPDLIWHNSATGQRRVWKMDGLDKVLDLLYGAQDRPNLVIADLHDMDGDGKLDAILQNPAGGRFIWFMDEHTKLSFRNIPGAGPNWNITGVDDMGADGKTNIIWEHNLVGGRNYWTLNDQYERILTESGQFFTTGPQWKIVAVHDMDGDGNPDIVWEHRGTGNRSIWLVDNMQQELDDMRRGTFAQEPVAWMIVGAGTLVSAKGSNADLSALTVSPGILTPSFAADVTAYTVEVDYDTGSIDITATLADADASLTINDQSTGSEVSHSVNLEDAGQSTAIEVVVTAADETTTKTYNVTVNRAAAPPPDPDLGITMVQVGSPGVTYTIPTGEDDSGTAEVAGGYHIAATQVTYELWYEVREWAEANGYHFQNQGMEGSVTGEGDWPDYNNIGKPPSGARFEPVTMVNWRDCIVWLNALSQKNGLSPVYRTAGGSVIMDSRDGNAAVVDGAVQTENNGYRLPTSMEWEMAARWKSDTSSTDGSIERGGRWWTPGNYASGATANYENAAATGAVAWYRENSDTGDGRKTQPVGLKNANHLGLYDMSGNVWEWCFDHPPWSGSNRVGRGGSWLLNAGYQRVGRVVSDSPRYVDGNGGFRFLRTP